MIKGLYEYERIVEIFFNLKIWNSPFEALNPHYPLFLIKDKAYSYDTI